MPRALFSTLRLLSHLSSQLWSEMTKPFMSVNSSLPSRGSVERRAEAAIRRRRHKERSIARSPKDFYHCFSQLPGIAGT
jgi:hypothetical protein